MCFTKYYKNFILCGEADHYCLLCDETFHKSEDIEKHIRWEKHRKLIKQQTCLTKFRNDGIFRIENYYYCSCCNLVVYNIASVKQHIGTEIHTTNKTGQDSSTKRIIAKYDCGTVNINGIKIETHQWHGIQNRKCIICNIDVINVLKHIETQEHIIRLIQIETDIEGDKCYRKLHESTFQCLKCMKTFPSKDFDQHWLQHDKVEPQIANGDTDHQIIITSLEEYIKLGNREYDIAKLANIKDEFYNIDLKNKEVICKQCNLAVRHSENDLKNHQYKHKNYKPYSVIIQKIIEDKEKEYILVLETDAGKARHKLAVYGKANHIKMNEGGSKGYCMLCDRYLSAHIKIFRQHVEGCVHTGHLELKGEIKAKKHKKGSTCLELFSRHLFKLDYITDLDAVAVNMTFCIDRHSFLLIKRIKHGKNFRLSKCFVCDETFKWWDEKKHCETKMHRSNVMAAKVVDEDLNFIREIKPKLYHCGVCNVTLPFWDALERHMDDLGHKMKVTAKHFVSVMKFYQKENGNLPESSKIELSSNSDVLYSNIMKVLYENRLGDLRIYTINLEKLQNSGCRGVVLV